MRRALAVACAVTLLFAGASSAAGKRVADSTGAVSVEVPKGWAVEKNMAECQKLNILGPSHKGLLSDITLVTKKADKLDLSIVAKGIEKNPSILDPGCKIISRSKTKLAGTPALVFVCGSAPSPNVPTNWFETVIAIRGRTAYLLTYSAAKDSFKADRSAFETVMKTFKWVNEPTGR